VVSNRYDLIIIFNLSLKLSNDFASGVFHLCLQRLDEYSKTFHGTALASTKGTLTSSLPMVSGAGIAVLKSHLAF
jgi:hypothetical protein